MTQNSKPDGSTPVHDLGTILDAVGDLVATIRDDQWRNDTPCPAWDVRALVTHMVNGNRLFAGILRGEVAVTPDALDPLADGARTLAEDAAASYRSAARELLAAFGQSNALERFVDVPFGRVPGVAAVHLRAVEELVHGWDLAVAIGESGTGRALERIQVPDQIIERELAFTRETLPEVSSSDDPPFAPPKAVADDAPALDRLAALLGRHAR